VDLVLRCLCDYLLKFFLAASGSFIPVAAQAAPWAEPGDNALRADIALLSSAGVLNEVGGQWPQAWSGILSDLDTGALGGQPGDIRAAATRVAAAGRAATQPGFSGAILLDVTNRPSLVYGFAGLGRGEGQLQLALDYNSGGTGARLALGAITGDFRGRTTKFMPDGTFLAQRLSDELLVYGGWLSHWWGPGWISALALSNNARPMPQIGFQRASSTASSWPLLNLLGPWQAEFFIGMLDDPRIDSDTIYNAMHLAFNPVPGLEIGLARTQQMCGKNHPCVPLRDFLQFNNDFTNVNATSEQGQIDIRWSRAVFQVPMQFYMSLMNEDSSPFAHSGTSHLFGVTAFLDTGRGPLRLTAEYADTVPTEDIFSFGSVFHGFAYNNIGYPDGMRYRGRTLGFSLDSDSKLLSLQGAWTDSAGRFYQLSFHNAHVSNPNNLSGNLVTTAPVRINIGEARITMPWNGIKLDLALRLQDDQPRPRSGFDAAFEVALRAPL
jgi:hypothetical protein